MGCELCQAIWHVTEHEDWDYDSEGLVTGVKIRIFAKCYSIIVF